MRPAFAPASGFDALSSRPAPLSVARPRPQRVSAARSHRAAESTAVAWFALAAVLVLELALALLPQGLQLSPLQATPLFKQLTGYTLVTLMVLAMFFGRVRRWGPLARRRSLASDLHQLGGVLILLLLGAHVGQHPSGFLLYLFHCMAYAVAAGAVRPVLARRIGREASTALLAVHISLSCLVAAAALVHLYFVYAYTA